MKHLIVIITLLMSGAATAQKQGNSLEIIFNFRANSTCIDTTYSTNAENLHKINAFVKTLSEDSTIKISNLLLFGMTSPDGSHRWNKKIGNERINNVEKLVRSHINIPDSIITRKECDIAWEYLASMVGQSDISHRSEILKILSEKPQIVPYYNDLTIDRRVLRLINIDKGSVWKKMKSRFFSPMQNALAVLITSETESIKMEEAETTAMPQEDTTYVNVDTMAIAPIENLPQENIRHPFYMALRTNMLYDAALIPNIGVEFYLGKNFSITTNWMYAWWDSNSKHNYWRIYGGDISLRRYIGSRANEKPLQGHHIGIYAQALTYDFELGDKGIMGGVPGGTIFDKLNYGAGIEYGYSLPISRHFNIDFNIGIGYLGGEYQEYKPIDGHYIWQATKKRNYWGPTKLEITLVWLLGHGNTNKAKGERR